MSNNIRSDSGDAFHAWKDVKCSRQGYANAAVAQYQRAPGIKKFADLLQVFRNAGLEYDRWTRERERAA